MIRLCIFQPFAERRGGSDNYLMTLLTHLDRTRCDPLVVFFGSGGFVDEVAAAGVRTQTLPAGRLRNPVHVLASARRVRRLLEREDPDLILNWLSTAHVYAGLGAKAAGLADRCVWFQHDLFGARSSAGGRLVDRLSTLRGRALDRVATAIPAVAVGCCSEAVRREQARLRPRRTTFTVLPGIDEPPQLSHDARRALREQLSMPDDAIVVGTVGRLFAWKGHHLLLRALAPLAREDRRIHGLIVGGGGHRPDRRYEAHLRTLAAELGLEGRVTFTGQVPEATSYLQAMDVFVNASTPEPFGIVLIEALALGIPAVAVAAGGPAEILGDGRSGILAPSSEPAELGAAISRIIDDPDLSASLAAAGPVRFRARFTGARMAREMQRQLEDLV